MKVKPTTLSASGLDTYLSCPKKYYYQKIEKLPEPPVGDAARIGTLIHEVFEKFYSLPPEERTVENLQQTAGSCVVEFKDSDQYMYLDASDEELEARMRVALDNIVVMDRPSEANVVAVEYEIRVTVGDAPLYGFIDQINRNGGGSLQVIDHKTGAVPGDKYVNDKLRQVFLYAAGLTAQGQEVSEVTLSYVSHAQCISREVTQKDLDKITKKFSSVWQKIVNEEFPEKPSPLCAWCPFEDLCPRGQAMAQWYRRKRASEGRPI